MAFDITIRHPAYLKYSTTWQLMRDASEGEDAIKARGETYLPMKSGTKAIADLAKRMASYDAYRARAEFPELLAPTVRGAVGVMLDDPAVIELSPKLELLRERATPDGLTLDGLHRRIAMEVMTTGRYGLLPGIDESGNPHLAGYCTEAIVNWDGGNYVVLCETSDVRDPATNKWSSVDRYRECYIEENGTYAAREWTKTDKGEWIYGDVVMAATPKKNAIGVPFVFIDTNDLTATPDDVPLYGLAKLSTRIYRLDADYTFALHMTSEPTPVVIGFDDAKTAQKNGNVPATLGAGTLWVLPKGADAKYLEFSGPGLEAQKGAINDAVMRARAFGAQLLSDVGKSAESGDALKLRLGSQTATIKTIAMNTAAGLERALRNLAVWVGDDPEKCVVTPNLDFFDKTLSAQEITAIVSGWQAGAYSWRTAFDRLKEGGVVPDDRTPEDELALITEDQVTAADQLAATTLPNHAPGAGV